MRKLASIKRIEEIKSIPDADKICAYRVGGWWIVDQINRYKVGDLAVYFEIDSFLPLKPEFEFLRSRCYKQNGNGEYGMQLRTIRLKRVVSQGLLLSLTFEAKEGDDVTELLGVTLYEKAIPAQLAGVVKGNFPSFLIKSDENRLQNFDDEELNNIKGQLSYVGEKCNGSSLTSYIRNNEFGVCSRNLELKESEGNAYWQAVRLLNLEEKLRKLNRNICLQGELIGPGIQGNMYNLSDKQVYFFTGYDIDTSSRLSFTELKTLLNELELKMVPIISDTFVVPDTNIIDYMLEIADGKSLLNPRVDREGVVVRGINKQFSFKVISNSFLLKEK